jgi:cobalt-zinc-cadmium efflux system protein
VHDHAHQQPHRHAVHSHGPRDYDRAFAVGIALNLGFVGIEAWFGLRSESLALLADAGHNLSDVAGLVLAWGGALAGKLRPGPRRTYGWKRASIFAAFANSLLLLFAMGALAWEALGRLLEHEAGARAQGLTIMAVAGVGIAVNTATAWLFMRGSEHDLNIRGAFLHMAADALVSAGVVLVGALTLWWGWTWLDPVVSLLISAALIWGTWALFSRSLHLLFDGVPHHLSLAEVRACLAGLPGVEAVRDLHVWALGTSQVALTAHLVVPEGETGDEFLREAGDRLFHGFGISHVTLQVVREAFGEHCDVD